MSVSGNVGELITLEAKVCRGEVLRSGEPWIHSNCHKTAAIVRSTTRQAHRRHMGRQAERSTFAKTLPSETSCMLRPLHAYENRIARTLFCPGGCLLPRGEMAGSTVMPVGGLSTAGQQLLPRWEALWRKAEQNGGSQPSRRGKGKLAFVLV